MPYPSHRQSRSLPRRHPWVFAGAALLAGIAGFINATVLSFFHVPVSHMSGAVSRLSIDVQTGDLAALIAALLIVMAFLLGAIISGALIGVVKLEPGRRYGVALMLEGAVLVAATLLLRRQLPGGVPLAAMACGIQNAMASSYYGLVIRTTHVTGIVTDLGVMIGAWIRHRRVHLWKMLLLSTILVSFFIGGIAGALAVTAYGAVALGFPASACLTGGFGYFVWRHLRFGPGASDVATPERDRRGSSVAT